jgi:hypothetical protein
MKSGSAKSGGTGSAINASGRGRFVYDNFVKTGTDGQKFLPKPRGHVFDSRIIEPRDLIEIRVIEQVDERLHRRPNFSVIIKPSGRWIDCAFHGDFNLETMSVHPSALVALRRFGQRLCRFKGEIFGQANAHFGATSHCSLRVSSFRPAAAGRNGLKELQVKMLEAMVVPFLTM